VTINWQSAHTLLSNYRLAAILAFLDFLIQEFKVMHSDYGKLWLILLRASDLACDAFVFLVVLIVVRLLISR